LTVARALGSVRAVTGDDFIKLGFWSQLVFLLLVDWGSIHALVRTAAPWYHWAGFFTINVLILLATVHIWSWLKDAKTPDEPA